MPRNQYVAGQFSASFKAIFRGKDVDDTYVIMDPTTLEYTCKKCFADDTCRRCVRRKEMDKLEAWKRCVKDSKVLRGYVLDIEDIEDMILCFCGWEEGIWRWLGESIDRHWRKQSVEAIRNGKWCPSGEYKDPKNIENMKISFFSDPCVAKTAFMSNVLSGAKRFRFLPWRGCTRKEVAT